jgi:hypothetical protein
MQDDMQQYIQLTAEPLIPAEQCSQIFTAGFIGVHKINETTNS